MSRRPDDIDIEIDDLDGGTDSMHDAIAYEAGYLSDDEYEATGMPGWWFDMTDGADS